MQKKRRYDIIIMNNSRVWLIFSKNIEIYDKSEYDLTTGDIVCPALLIGHYKIKDDVATVTIVEDNLFNGDYLNKVIYLQKAPLS